MANHGKKRTGIYAGTFDPLTNGHLTLIKRGMALVDRLIIGVAENPAKNPMFDQAARIDLIHQVIGEQELGGNEIRVAGFDGLLVDFARDQTADFIIRGLRALADFDHEFQMTMMNRALDPGIETVFLMADSDHQFISSRFVKEAARLNGDVSDFLPPACHDALMHELGRTGT
jgi:pantetheine-phosphate adenylyltransferase